MTFGNQFLVNLTSEAIHSSKELLHLVLDNHIISDDDLITDSDRKVVYNVHSILRQHHFSVRMEMTRSQSHLLLCIYGNSE